MYEIVKTVFFTLGATALGLGGMGLLAYFYNEGQKEGFKKGAKINDLENRMIKIAEVLAETE